VEAKSTLSAAGVPSRELEGELRNLMVRYQAGDRPAMEALVGELSPQLMRFLSGPQVSRADAEDLLQECWMRIHRSRHTYRGSEPLLPWIYAIARHTRLDGYRRRQRRGAREVLVSEVPERAHQPSGKAQPPDLMRLLEQLPESQREVVTLLKVSGMSLEDVARATASSVGAVKQKAHRAYARLRELLAQGEPQGEANANRL
jgi:RNA polymerase sigma-70 factor (ECF subfamily)